MAVRLAQHTTLRLGGPAAKFVRADSTEALVDSLRAADEAGEEVLLLGGGSNLVVADAGFPGTVLQVAASNVSLERDRKGDDAAAIVRAAAGASWDDLVARAIDEGLSGIEALSGIPGSVGATPMQNVGAYGQEVGDVIRRVHVYDRAAGALRWMSAAECGFGYRSSHFRGRSDRVVVEVEFALARSPLSSPIRYKELAHALGVGDGDRAPLRRVRETVIALRRGKGMVLDAADPESQSAGSFFTNPLVLPSVAEHIDASSTRAVPRFPAGGGRVKLPAAWLIEGAGFHKGQRFGRVHISKKHALALVTEVDATTDDLLNAARAIRRGVIERFDVALEPEPIFVGCAL